MRTIYQLFTDSTESTGNFEFVNSPLKAFKEHDRSRWCFCQPLHLGYKVDLIGHI